MPVGYGLLLSTALRDSMNLGRTGLYTVYLGFKKKLPGSQKRICIAPSAVKYEKDTLSNWMVSTIRA